MSIGREAELFMAVCADRRDVVNSLLAEGVDPNRSLSPDEYLFCLDWLSAGKPDKHPPPRDIRGSEVGRFLVADYDPEKRLGFYPLLIALDNPDIVEMLLAGGADPDFATPHRGNTALHELSDGYRHDGAALSASHLVKAGAHVDSVNRKGETPLIHGCYRKADGGFLEILLSHGASVHARDGEGNTALHMAGFWDEGYLPWRLDNYREWGDPIPDDIDAPDPGDGISYPTRSWGALEAVNTLVDAGADPNSVNPNNGYTPMHWASVHHGQAYLSFLKALFERGGKVDIPNKAGMRPMDFFVFTGEKEFEDLSRRFAEAAGRG